MTQGHSRIGRLCQEGLPCVAHPAASRVLRRARLCRRDVAVSSVWVDGADLEDLPAAALTHEGHGDVPSGFGEVGGFAGDVQRPDDPGEEQLARLDALDVQWEVFSDEVARAVSGVVDRCRGPALLVQQARQTLGPGQVPAGPRAPLDGPVTCGLADVAVLVQPAGELAWSRCRPSAAAADPPILCAP